MAKAFEAKQGDPPQSAPTGEGYAIFQVTGIVAAHAPTFADWKTHVLDDYRDEQLPALLSQKTAELADKGEGDERSGQGRQGGGRNGEDQRPGRR